MTTLNIVQKFIDYHRAQGFEILGESSLLDPMIPMTFVMSAGLTHIESTTDQSQQYAGKRYVLVQTCFRHFDMDKVGQSPVHLSLFRMAGAFYFGETSKREVIHSIWRYLTHELGFDPQTLSVTYFQGGELDGHRIEPDTETFQAWTEIGLAPSRIQAAGIDANFWKQGGGLSGKERLRKCGPTTEVFYDRGSELRCGPACRPGCRCGRYIEISNVLFIHSYIDEASGALLPLVTPFIETVVGVERAAMARGNHSSVFELPCLAPLVEAVRARQDADRPVPDASVHSPWVIADHIRALLFLTADGAPAPGKGGRAGIMRRLIRETVTHQKHLGIVHDTVIADIIKIAIDVYRRQRPDLDSAREPLLSHFSIETQRFEHTLAAGYRRLDRILDKSATGSLSGRQAIDLVKHHGLPLLLLENELARKGVRLDRRGYRRAYLRWRQAEVGR